MNILDEVTGLAINPTSLLMTAEDATHYSVIIPFTMGSVVKYRYAHIGASVIQEHLSNGRSVRYRMVHVEGPGIVEDTLSRWTDSQFTGTTGRITGRITDAATGAPISNLLITAGGSQVFTTADGGYLLEGLPPGTHNLLAYAIDGGYQTYQQGATVAPNSTTPASFTLTLSQMVPVVFSVSVPVDTPTDAPLRLAGNLFQLGNTFADLSGGVSTIASRMPILNRLPDGRYAVTISLPVGAAVEYKYTLGDGLWNSEHNAEGAFLIRHLIVPSDLTELSDEVINWGTGQLAPITFDVTVPTHTPADEGVSIQFNPGFGWLQSLPMWPVPDSQGNVIWRFIVISPLSVLETIQYRICRADQCGVADDVNTPGAYALGNIVNTSESPQTIHYSVANWIWFQSTPEQASIPNVAVNNFGSSFIAGIAFDASYHPSWGTHLNNAINMTSILRANWLYISPTWTFTRNLPIVLEPLPSQDILLPELITSIQQASSLGINVGLFPIPHFPVDSDQWWQLSPRDFPWWVSWFDCYTQFILNYADLSSHNNVGSLVIGGDWLSPALPGGLLSDGTPSGVPEDTEFRWRELIRTIREHYSGTLAWALPYPHGVQKPPAFLDSVDQITILLSAPLSNNLNASIEELKVEVDRILDQEIAPLQLRFGKPIVIAVSYPSADGSAAGCAGTSDGACVPNLNLAATRPEVYLVSLDLQEQSAVYNALFMSINEHTWVSGLISMGFYPPVALQDTSLSIYSKPASGVIWYWFSRLLGLQP